MSGSVRVSTEELHAAASTLSRVDGSLTGQGGGLALGSHDCGSAALSAAVADFCQQAGDVATAFSAAVGAAAVRVNGAGTSYERTEHATAASFGGARP